MPDVPLHNCLWERMDESRLSWIDFLHEHTQKKRARKRTTEEQRGEDDEPEHAAMRGQKTKADEFVRRRSGPTIRRMENTTVNEWNATVSPPSAQEIMRRR